MRGASLPAAVLVPPGLRAGPWALWGIADRTAVAFGTRAGRVSALWRLPARGLWWAMLLAQLGVVACYGNAHLSAAPVRPARSHLAQALLAPVTVLAAIAAAGNLVMAVTDPGWVNTVVGAWMLMVTVEFAPSIYRAISRGPGAATMYDRVRAAGFSGEVVEVALLAGEGDAGVLARGWLRHVDNTGLAVIAEARTPALARLYRRAGFHPVDGNPLALYRLPAGHLA